MEKFEFKVRIQAKSEQDAVKILTALFDIKKAISDEELLKVAEVIKKKPNLVKKLKAFL